MVPGLMPEIVDPLADMVKGLLHDYMRTPGPDFMSGDDVLYFKDLFKTDHSTTVMLSS
jgi:hypothetical protein